jgi:hypothetical protein
MLQTVAWMIVLILLALSVWCLWSAWRLWRQERREPSDGRWRLRRSVRAFRRSSAGASFLHRERKIDPPRMRA